MTDSASTNLHFPDYPHGFQRNRFVWGIQRNGRENAFFRLSPNSGAILRSPDFRSRFYLIVCV